MRQQQQNVSRWRKEAVGLTFDAQLYPVQPMMQALDNLGLVGLPRPLKELAALHDPAPLRLP